MILKSTDTNAIKNYNLMERLRVYMCTYYIYNVLL